MSNDKIHRPSEQFTVAYALQQYREKNYDEVERVCHNLLETEPNRIDILNVLAALALKTDKPDTAISFYQQLARLEPNNSSYYTKIGSIAFALNRTEQSLESYRKAYALDPKSTNACLDLGCACASFGYTQEAISLFEQVLTAEPNNITARWNRAISLLVTGNFQVGFAEYEKYRWQHATLFFKSPDYFSEPIWDGSDINHKTILLHTDDGYGDTIQFIRYAPLVRATGAKVIFACPKPLLRLLSVVKGIDQLLEENAIEEGALPKFDVHAPLLSLPYCLSTNIDNIPKDIPYISLSTLKLQFPNNLPEISDIPPQTVLKVGIVWTSGSRQRAEKLNLRCGQNPRDCPLSYFIKLLSIEGVSLFSLQMGESASELDSFREDERIQDLSSLIQDFVDTAVLIDQLDLIISIDTSVAHLAGAIGAKVWTLLPFFPDWRWLKDRSDTPWYPTMRLFRQRNPQDWDSVFAQVIPALEKERDFTKTEAEI